MEWARARARAGARAGGASGRRGVGDGAMRRAGATVVAAGPFFLRERRYLFACLTPIVC